MGRTTITKQTTTVEAQFFVAYLLISDTSEINHFVQEATTGLGLVGTGSNRGMHLHSCLVYNSGTKQIVGVAGAAIHYRHSVSKKETRMQLLRRDRESEWCGRFELDKPE